MTNRHTGKGTGIANNAANSGLYGTPAKEDITGPAKIAKRNILGAPSNVPKTRGIVCVRMMGVGSASRPMKTARTTGTATPAANIMRWTPSVPRQTLIAGIARTKHVARLTTSERRANIFGIAKAAKRDTR